MDIIEVGGQVYGVVITQDDAGAEIGLWYGDEQVAAIVVDDLGQSANINKKEWKMAAAEEHPKYAEWREALEEHIAACKASDNGLAGVTDAKLARERLDDIISQLD